MSIGNRVRALRVELGLRQIELANRIGFSQGRLSNYERDFRQPSGEELVKLASALGSTVDYLLLGNKARETGKAKATSNLAVARSGYVVPVLDLEQAANWQAAIKAGTNKTIDSQVKEATFALSVVGDVMSPTFPDGSTVVINVNRKPKTGDYVVALVDGSATFKQVVYDGGKTHLKPVNPAYPMATYDSVQVIGVAVELILRKPL